MSLLLNREHTNGQVTNASYAKVIETVLKSGVQADDRTGTGTLSTCYVPSYYMLTGG
ncbi:TPA: thymidylate synthase, partial [Escherichia coli]